MLGIPLHKEWLKWGQWKKLEYLAKFLPKGYLVTLFRERRHTRMNRSKYVSMLIKLGLKKPLRRGDDGRLRLNMDRAVRAFRRPIPEPPQPVAQQGNIDMGLHADF
jgi:hypothetical protein